MSCSQQHNSQQHSNHGGTAQSRKRNEHGERKKRASRSSWDRRGEALHMSLARRLLLRNGRSSAGLDLDNRLLREDRVWSPLPRSPSRAYHALLLGKGKDGTSVYAADTGLPSVYPPGTCVSVTYASSGTCRTEPTTGNKDGRCIDPTDHAALHKAGLTASVAIKDVHDEASAAAESVINLWLRDCFRRGRVLKFTTLHPKLCSVSAGGHTLIPMRRFTRTLGSGPMPLESASDVLEVAASVGSVLRAMHAADMLHMDVKPSNILVLRERATASGASAVGGSVALGDYDLAAHVDDVIDALQDGPVNVGTPGYVSPVLTGSISSKYAACLRGLLSAGVGGAGSQFTLAEWRGHFASARNRIVASRSHKVARDLVAAASDLHPLALTLYELDAEAHGPQRGRIRSPAVASTILGLLSGDVASAKDLVGRLLKPSGRAA